MERSLGVLPARVRPELVADGLGQVRSWDSPKLGGPSLGRYHDPYLVLGICSRVVVA